MIARFPITRGPERAAARDIVARALEQQPGMVLAAGCLAWSTATRW